MTMRDEKRDDAIAVLCAFLAEGIGSFRGNTVAEVILDDLIAWGAAVEVGPVRSIWCDECDLGHFADVVTSSETNELGWMCPEVGFVSADPMAAKAYEFRSDEMAELLAEGVTASRSFDRLPSYDGVWRLGQRSAGTGRAEILLVSKVDAFADVTRIRSAEESLPPAHAKVLLVAGNAIERTEALAGWFTFPLCDLLIVRNSALRIDEDELDLRIENAMLKSPPAVAGRPSKIEKTQRVLSWLRSHSLLESGRNAQVRQVIQYWPEVFDGQTAPPVSTLNKHVTKLSNRPAD